METEDGLKPIEEIEVGDMVLAYDEETGEQAYKPVVQLFRNETKEWYHIFANGEEIVCTGGHPFYVPELDKFIPARELKISEKLLLSSGTYAIIEEIQIEQLSEPETTYNFEVADFHTYYVSESNVLVHNMCAKADGVVDDALDWSRQRPDGMTTEQHVRLHEVANNTKLKHSIFNGDSVQITNQAWGNRANAVINNSGANIVYRVPYVNAGITGGSSVAVSQTCNGVAIVIQRGTSNLLVTSYPIII